MSTFNVYGTFIKKGESIFRTEAFLQFGESTEIIGCCLFANPGAARLVGPFESILREDLAVQGEMNSDPTLEELAFLIKEINNGKELSGRFYIKNVINLRDSLNESAAKLFEKLLKAKRIDPIEMIDSIEDISQYPYVLLGYGPIENTSIALRKQRDEWLDRIRQSGIPHFGAKHTNLKDFAAIHSHIPSQQAQLRSKILKAAKAAFDKKAKKA